MAESEQEVKQLDKILSSSEFKPIKPFWKDKEGKNISYNEFMNRWKEGMRGITPLQQIKMQLNSMYIMLIGILCGLVITFFNLKNLWWLTIILSAALFNTSVQAIGLWQKKDALMNIEKIMEGIE